MKLPYATKYNGKYYLAGQEIPVEEKKEEKPTIEEKEIVEEKTEEKVEKKPTYRRKTK